MGVQLLIRKIDVTDLSRLREISLETFIDTYAQFNDPKNFQKHLDKAFHLEQLQKEIQDPNCYYYFAEIDSEVKGYIKLNTYEAQTENLFENAIEIERIYVLSSEKGKGIGKKLIKHSLKIANELKKEILWLGVWEKNPKAITFYEKMKFELHSKHTFMLGNDPQTDYVLKMDVPF